MNHLSDMDTKPWYRQFWPWFLIALPGSVVIASFNMLYLAVSSADDMVIDEYYKEGLAINRQLEKRQLAEQLGLGVQLAINTGEVVVFISGPVTDASLEMRLSHPMEADRDFRTLLYRVGPGIYSGALDAPVATRWHWTLSAGDNSAWRLDGVIDNTDFAQPAQS
ncbi:hypothetical protein CWI75_06865 [Kineobactrum sediminis]|uniref:Nitrogen fixation protein FixH n=1 Tax=Kineobactrum sediminis TaxID=1905677 RepID=A0A2N5Y419_9GAMM|nr:FixH family protein [Kineobactrum sediminis]PLW83132.1 hypothetical protein CWI75_06865 [Kineobactrum sediminis]